MTNGLLPLVNFIKPNGIHKVHPEPVWFGALLLVHDEAVAKGGERVVVFVTQVAD